MTNDEAIRVNAIGAELQRQRDANAARAAQLAGDLAIATARIDELEAAEARRKAKKPKAPPEGK